MCAPDLPKVQSCGWSGGKDNSKRAVSEQQEHLSMTGEVEVYEKAAETEVKEEKKLKDC